MPRRRSSKKFPSHIDPQKLPKGIYWDSTGKGHWYISYFTEDGKQRRKRVAGLNAKMSDLHVIIESQSGVVRNTFNYICEKYFASSRYRGLASSTQKLYTNQYKYISTYKLRSEIDLGQVDLKSWTMPMAQRLADKFSETRGPTAANHSIRFAKAVFNWSMQRGYASMNPWVGVEMAKEVRKSNPPTTAVYNKVLEFAKTSKYDYIWMVMELAYLGRMRGIEVVMLTDENELEQGLLVKRTKGSLNNIIRWNPRLREVWDAAKSRRNEIQKKKSVPIPSRPNQRSIFVTREGLPLKKEALDTAWQRVITSALNAGIIDEEDRFSPHDLKHLGVTNTKGNRADRQAASGHCTEAMANYYTHRLEVVDVPEDD